MGINRHSGGTEDRKRLEKDAKAGDELPQETEEAVSRLEASKEPSEDPEKSRVVEKAREQNRDEG